MAEQFVILDNGETMIIGEWVPPPDEIATRMFHLADMLEDYSTVMKSAIGIAVASTEAHFDSESDPSGQKWPELNPDYEFYKNAAGFGDEILVRTGAGRAAAIDPSNYFVTENELFFNAGNLPHDDDGWNYMSLHQSGTGGPSPDVKPAGRALTHIEAASLLAGSGSGKALPQREWLGLDQDSIAELEALFNSWFEMTIDEVFPTESGGFIAAPTGFNALGEFPIIGYTKRGQPLLRTPSGVRFGRM